MPHMILAKKAVEVMVHQTHQQNMKPERHLFPFFMISIKMHSVCIPLQLLQEVSFNSSERNCPKYQSLSSQLNTSFPLCECPQRLLIFVLRVPYATNKLKLHSASKCVQSMPSAIT